MDGRAAVLIQTRCRQFMAKLQVDRKRQHRVCAVMMHRLHCGAHVLWWLQLQAVLQIQRWYRRIKLQAALSRRRRHLFRRKRRRRAASRMIASMTDGRVLADDVGPQGELKAVRCVAVALV